MNNFITNDDDKELKKRLIELVEHSKEMKFLVGFFYFSGIRELYKGLQNNNDAVLNILVGMNIDQSNFRLVEYAAETEELSNEEIKESFLRDIKKSLTHEDFDTKDFYDQVRFFIKLIVDGRIIIRKTLEPNHAKLYFFHLPQEVGRKKMFVTGSSNLTRLALTTQAEFNVEISDYGIQDAEEYFDKWWAEAVAITEDDALKKKLQKIIEQETLVKEVTPFEAYVLTLKTYLDSFEQKKIGQSLKDVLEENGYTPFKYQLDAVQQGLAMIEQNNGVIIADVVGLGKTIIACSIARELKKRGVVICPPGLMGDRNKTTGWRMYLEQFRLFDWEVRSVGDLENTLEYVNNTNDIEVVIVDEVHRFRNQDTQDYEFLKNICRDKIVIELTATPFNNRPGDILSLLKLFITPKKSKITLENNLVAMFRSFKGAFDRLSYINKNWKSTRSENRDKAQALYEAEFGEPEIDLKKVKERTRFLADQIRHVIEPVTIRRNRLDLKNNPFYKDEVKNLSEIADPKEWFYELNEKQSAFYDKMLTDYFGDPEEGGKFKGAIYKPFQYERGIEEELSEEENFDYFSQRNLFDFMRRLLVKRFESSFGSFKESIVRFKSIAEHALIFIENNHKYILDRGLLEKIYSEDEEFIEEQLEKYAQKLREGHYPKNSRIYLVDTFKLKDQFIADIKSDIALYETILKELEDLDLVREDPKGICLMEQIERVMKWKPKPGEPKRKVIIFTEYYDTVTHLEKTLREKFGDRVLVIKGTLGPAQLKEINQNFDAMYKTPKDDYDILLSTDRLSEGFNLNRAGMVINYDIPWNPVRVIQRVGRINRISKRVFDELFIVNFFPTERGSQLVQSREIATNKMFLIHQILGEDSKIFDIDEEPSAAKLWERVTASPESMEEESFYTKVLRTFEAIKKDEQELVASLKDYPARVKVAKAGTENELLVFLRKGRLYIQGKKYNAENDGEIFSTGFEEVIDRVACTKDTPRLELSKDFWKYYKDVKEHKESYPERASERSLESRAINLLKTMNKKPWEELIPELDFVRMLLDDIMNYGSLSDYTLRRIANFEISNAEQRKKTLHDLREIKKEIGADYLTPIKAKDNQIHKQIIIAIENQKP